MAATMRRVDDEATRVLSIVGAILAALGAVFLIVGVGVVVATILSMGMSDAPVVGLALFAVGIFLLVLGIPLRLMGRSLREQVRAVALSAVDGVELVGRVLSAEPTNAVIAGKREHMIRLQLTPAQEDPRDVTVRAVFEHGAPSPGDEIRLWVDPTSHDVVALEK
jgi:hypothetical protein